MLTIDYKGKVVLVTGKRPEENRVQALNTSGGGRGIGLAITKAFAKGSSVRGAWPVS